MTAATSLGLSVCCLTSGRHPERLASILTLFAPVADEVVVAVEEPRVLETHAALGGVADVVLSFPPTHPSDRPIPWLFGSCRGRWIFNVDDDEVPSAALLEMLPAVAARDDITHAWVARRWLYPTTATYLAEAPWNTEFQLRLLLADPRFTQFSDVFHRPVIAHGPGLYLDGVLWHLDNAITSVARRRSKAEAYELERPGMRISGRSHNHALYVPELAPEPRLAPFLATSSTSSSVSSPEAAGSSDTIRRGSCTHLRRTSTPPGPGPPIGSPRCAGRSGHRPRPRRCVSEYRRP